MNNSNSNTSQGDQIAAAFIRAVVDAVLANPDLNKSLISFSNGIAFLQGRMDALEESTRKSVSILQDHVETLNTRQINAGVRLDALEGAKDKGAEQEQDDDILRLLGEVSEMRDQFAKLKGRFDDVEDTVSDCDGLRHRVVDLEEQVEDMDAVTTDQVEDIVADKIVDHLDHLGSHVAKAITLKGLSMIVAHTETEDGKI